MKTTEDMRRGAPVRRRQDSVRHFRLFARFLKARVGRTVRARHSSLANQSRLFVVEQRPVRSCSFLPRIHVQLVVSSSPRGKALDSIIGVCTSAAASVRHVLRRGGLNPSTVAWCRVWGPQFACFSPFFGRERGGGGRANTQSSRTFRSSDCYVVSGSEICAQGEPDYE